MNTIRNFLAQFMAHNLVTILRRLDAEIERLEKAIESYDAVSEYHTAKVVKHDAKAATATTDADRAAALAKKLRDLVS